MKPEKHCEPSQDCAFRTTIGGQALIEGILMRGPEKQAIVVRDKDGQLVEKVEKLRLIKDRYPILGWPLIRGTVTKAAYEKDDPQAAQIAMGQVLGRIHDVKPAAQIIQDMMDELYAMHRRVSNML